MPDEVPEVVNPKTLIGQNKPSLTTVPGPALVHVSLAMMNGAFKYGKYNWRETKVPLSIYIDAAYRHLLAFNDGENYAEDSGVHHLGHVMACCAIMLDALEGEHCIDDRGAEGTSSEVISIMSQKLPSLLKRWEAAKRKQELNAS